MQALFCKTKKAISATNARPIAQEIFSSPYLNSARLYKLLHQNRQWAPYLPDEVSKGVTKFTADLINTWSGSELQSFIVKVTRDAKARLTAAREAHRPKSSLLEERR